MITALRQDKRVHRAFWNVVSYVMLAMFLVFFLFPMFWMVITTFKPNVEMTTFDQPLWVENPTLDNFRLLFEETPFFSWLANSLLVAIVTTLISVVLGTLAAYALVRYRFPGTRVMGMGVFVVYLVPQTLLFIPMTYVINQLGIYNSLAALIVVYPTIMIPFCIWLLMGFFRSIPPDMEECARVDGATRWQAFRLIALPLARSGIVSAVIFTFTLSWSEYLYALVLVPSFNVQTLPVGIPNALALGDVFFWGAIMAAALLGSLPVVLLYALSMRSFVAGMTAGAVKG